MKVSVVIPTNRPAGLELAAWSLVRQTFADFEVLVGSPFDPGPGPWRWIPDRFEGGFWTLSRCYNSLIDAARGELIVSLQDFIWVPPDGLEKFAKLCEQTRGIVTGVSDQYDSIGLNGSLGPLHWRDVRRDNYPVDRGPQVVVPSACEWNWCICPRAALIDIGGFDEGMDFLGFCGDAISVVERLYDNGLPFHIDPSNEVYAQYHEHGPLWNQEHTITTGRYNAQRAALKGAGRWPRLTRAESSLAQQRRA